MHAGVKTMPRGSKSKYTSRQKRTAEKIEEGYKKRGVGTKEAERRAWATVNKTSGGGKKSGSGRGKTENKSSSRKGGRIGGASASRSKSTSTKGRSTRSRSEAAKKGWKIGRASCRERGG